MDRYNMTFLKKIPAVNITLYRIKSLFSALSHAKIPYLTGAQFDYAVGLPASECARAASSLTKALMQVSSSGS